MGVVLKGVSEGYDWQFFQKNLLEGNVIEPGDTTSGNRAIISRVIADKLLLKKRRQLYLLLRARSGARTTLPYYRHL